MLGLGLRSGWKMKLRQTFVNDISFRLGGRCRSSVCCSFVPTLGAVLSVRSNSTARETLSWCPVRIGFATG